MQLALCGEEPNTILRSAMSAINFHSEQQQLLLRAKTSHLEKKLKKMQDACVKKLQEVHNGYTKVCGGPCYGAPEAPRGGMKMAKAPLCSFTGDPQVQCMHNTHK